jgi:putative membrane protein
MIIKKRIPFTYWLNLIKWDSMIVVGILLITSFISGSLTYVQIPITIGVFLGTAIALLLSFKLSQSYDRWWEARKIWGAITNDSRTFVLQLKNFTKKEHKGVTDKMSNRQIAWCYSLSQSLRNQNTTDNLSGFVTKQELDSIQHFKNTPLALMDNQSRNLAELQSENAINDFQHMQIDNTLVRLCTSMGQAERIKNTAFPKTYRLTLRLFLYIFLVTLSLALTELPLLVEIPLMLLISLPFFLVERIALNIQDPFENKPTDTPITSISKTIETNIKQLIDSEYIPEPATIDKFYIL